MVRRITGLAKIAILVACISGLCAAQQKGSVAGTVIDLLGEPVEDVMVQLQVLSAGIVPEVHVASSDAQGNFRLDGLDPARYSLLVQKTGFLRINSEPDGTPLVLDLTSSRTLTAVAIKMTPVGVISGTISVEGGGSLTNARVILAQWVFQNGKKRLAEVSFDTVDSSGSFKFGDLAPGSYVVAAAPGPGLGPPAKSGSETAYTMTYYPGVTDLSDAVAIPVAAGDFFRARDLSMRKAPSYRIHGKIAGDSNPPGYVQLSVKDLPNIFQVGLTGRIDAQDGTFEIGGVSPGVYVLEMPLPNLPGQVGRQIVTVTNQDLEDVVLKLGQGAEIAGKISVDGPFPPQRVWMLSPFIGLTDPVRQQDITGAAIEADGTFAIHHIPPGTYQVSVLRPPGLYVKSIRYGSQELTKSLLDLTSDSSGVLDVILSPNGADISGIVRGGLDGSPAAGAAVTFWTAGATSNDLLDFSHPARADSKGQFKFSDVPPGDYRVIALEKGEWQRSDAGLALLPAFRARFENRATTVKLNEKDHARIQPALIPADAIEAEAAKLK